MPVRSRAQAAYLAIHRPDLLHKWQLESPVNLAALPEHVKPKSKATHRPGHHAAPRRNPAGLLPRSKR
jgi:hypothetical protein